MVKGVTCENEWGERDRLGYVLDSPRHLDSRVAFIFGKFPRNYRPPLSANSKHSTFYNRFRSHYRPDWSRHRVSLELLSAPLPSPPLRSHYSRYHRTNYPFPTFSSSIRLFEWLFRVRFTLDPLLLLYRSVRANWKIISLDDHDDKFLDFVGGIIIGGDWDRIEMLDFLCNRLIEISLVEDVRRRRGRILAFRVKANLGSRL